MPQPIELNPFLQKDIKQIFAHMTELFSTDDFDDEDDTISAIPSHRVSHIIEVIMDLYKKEIEENYILKP